MMKITSKDFSKTYRVAKLLNLDSPKGEYTKADFVKLYQKIANEYQRCAKVGCSIKIDLEKGKVSYLYNSPDNPLRKKFIALSKKVDKTKILDLSGSIPYTRKITKEEIRELKAKGWW